VLRGAIVVVPGVFALATLVSGCGNDGAATDAAVPDGAALDGSATSADIPWLDDGVPPIAIAPCPDGWRAFDDGSGVTNCDPYPEGGARACSDGQAHFPGEPACAPVGSTCPVGDFSDTLPADAAVVYVQPGGTGDGTTPATPHGSVAAFSVRGLAADTVIALSRGTHPGPIRLERRIALWGACAAATVVTTDETSDLDAVITVRDARGEVRDLTVARSPRVGVGVVGAGAEAVVDGVVVSEAETTALASLDGAAVSARRSPSQRSG